VRRFGALRGEATRIGCGLSQRAQPLIRRFDHFSARRGRRGARTVKSTHEGTSLFDYGGAGNAGAFVEVKTSAKRSPRRRGRA